MTRIALIFLAMFFVSTTSVFSADKKVDDKKKAEQSKKKKAPERKNNKKKAQKTWDWRKALPEIGGVYPAGGQRGTEVEIVLCGQRLRGVDKAVVSGGGVEILKAEYIRSVNPKFYRRVQYEFTCMLSKKYGVKEPKKPKEPKQKKPENEIEKTPDNVLLKNFDNMTRRYIELTADKIFTRVNRLQEAPSLRESVIIKLKIDKDAQPGVRELRLWSVGRGLSNPLRFYISDLPEVTEYRMAGPMEKLTTNVELPAILNGQVMPGEVDSFTFDAKKGKKLVFAVMARRIIPYLGDAVPGWFQPVISIYNKDGKELKFEDDFNCSPDPVMAFNVPATGKYELRIRDSIYRGRKDFVYRIMAGELPFVTSIYPLGAQDGTTSKVKLQGYNLKEKQIEVSIPENAYDMFRVEGAGTPAFNPVCLAVDSFPERNEKEDNNSNDDADAVKTGTVINGRINAAGDIDVFKIKAKKGEKLVFDVGARKYGSPLDACISLTNSDGKLLFNKDDADEPNIGLNTHKADPYTIYTVPEDGTYFLTVRDIQNHGGDAYSYRLRISNPRPDFRVYTGNSSLTIRRWQTIDEPFKVVRLDGFKGPVNIKDASKNPVFKVLNPKLAKETDKIKLQLINRSSGKTPPPFKVNFAGCAKIDGKMVTRKVVPCENMMQAFIYYHWVPFNDLTALKIMK